MGRSNKKNICKMNIEIVRDYKKLINEKFDDFVRGLIMKYQEEISKLQDVIITSSNLIKEKETLMEELKKELEENKFEEANFNNVSLIKNLTKQVDELKNQNNLLNKKSKKSKSKKDVVVEETVEDNNTVVEDNNEVEDYNAVVEDNNTVVEDTKEVVEDSKDEVNVDQEPNSDDEEETIEIYEIEHEGKTYFLENNIVFSKKKSGD